MRRLALAASSRCAQSARSPGRAAVLGSGAVFSCDPGRGYDSSHSSSILAAVTAACAIAAGSGSSPSGCRDDPDEELPPGRQFDAARWADTLARIKDGIVSLSVTSVRAFDTHSAGAGQATGFVVDAEQGLILTNRHVVTEGPVVATALFDNHEEVDVHALYRDPVHDFGIFKYDPKSIKHLSHVAELKLRPDKAVQGLDVRVIGNNAGEKLSVLGAMLARLDREAPAYGKRTYNDFNTFYFQAASATSGGSSGSPVVDSEGDVVALNAAGKVGTSASFYLPLDRVKRAVDLLRKGLPVTRGTLQTTFVFTPFFELARLGLSETEAQVARDAGETVGMLVVKSIVPQGPLDNVLEPGDILLSIDGSLLTRFKDLEAILDDSAGRQVLLAVDRGGQRLELKSTVQDLHSITPHEFLECGDSIFTNWSYQLARTHNLPIQGVGVYVAAQGYMLRLAGVPTGSIITSVGSMRTRDVRELERALASYPDGFQLPVHFMRVSDPAQNAVAMMRVDRTWFPMQMTVRDKPERGAWKAEPSPGPPASSPEHLGANGLVRHGSKVRFAPGDNAVEKKLVRSIAKVVVSVPLPIDGMPSTEFVGTGLVVDAERGLILCDRNTVPSPLLDCLLTFGSSCTIPAHVAYVHPLHNLAVLRYDPLLLEGSGVEAAKLKCGAAHELVGKKFWHLTSMGSLRTGETLVSDQATAIESEPPSVPPSTPPRWQETNIDLISLKGGAPMAATHDGAIANNEGEIVAYWASFLTQTVEGGRLRDGQYFAGITCDTIEDMLGPLRRGETPPVMHALGTEMEKVGLAAVRGILMDADTTDEVEAACKHWPPRAMSVRRRWAGSDAASVLQDNDLLLEIDGQLVETFRDIEMQVLGKPEVSLLVVRRGKKLTLKVKTIPLIESVTERVILWCGALLQAPPIAIAAQRGQEQCGVYVSSRFHGSPAATYNLPPMARIVEVDGQPTPDVDALLRVVGKKKDGDSVRIKRLDLRGAPSMTTLRIDTKYWPTTEIRRVAEPRTSGGDEPYHWRRSVVRFEGDSDTPVFHDLLSSLPSPLPLPPLSSASH